MSELPSELPKAPDGWMIWQGLLDGEGSERTLEYPLYSDSHWRDELTSGIGPFRVLNTLGSPGLGTHYGHAFPALALQVDLHGEEIIMGIASKTDPGSYHGGWVDEEVAALVGLALNVRCRSGGLWRDFRGDDGGGRGNPYLGSFEPPTLVAPKGPGWAVLPHLTLEADLGELPRYLNRYAELDASTATSLVRAARLFQQAIWLADADPSLAWVLLVSALEAGADSWGGAKRHDALTQIKANWTELGDLLSQVHQLDEGLAAKLARLLRANVKVQAKVKRFVAAHLPIPPEPRPAFDGIEWDTASIDKAVGKIYRWRSDFLHAAIPFPGPMCQAPRRDDAGAFTECPGGLGTGIGDASWLAADTPMVLWPFAYLVNEVLRSWWIGEGIDDS